MGKCKGPEKRTEREPLILAPAERERLHELAKKAKAVSVSDYAARALGIRRDEEEDGDNG